MRPALVGKNDFCLLLAYSTPSGELVLDHVKPQKICAHVPRAVSALFIQSKGLPFRTDT